MVAALTIEGGITIEGGVTIGNSGTPSFTVTPTDFLNAGGSAGYNTSQYQLPIGGTNSIVNWYYGLTYQTGSVDTAITSAWTAAGLNLSDAYAWNATFASYTAPYSNPSATGALYFNPNQYLSYSNDPGFDQSAGAWTVEAWVLPLDTTNSNKYIYAQSTTNMFLLTWAGTNTTGTFSVDQNGVGFQINSANTFPSGYWYHVAMVYNGTNTLTLYVNGVAQGTYSVTPAGMAASANATEIGAYANNQGWYGEITNVRVVKGVAVYTGNFTVPTDPLQATQSAGTNISAISGTETQLLLNTTQAQTYTDSSTYNRSATTSGTYWTPSTPFVGATTSNYSCIARVSYTSDAIQFTVIDQTDTSWQTGGVGGPALLGVFRLPVTFTAYSPTTMLSNNNNWC